MSDDVLTFEELRRAQTRERDTDTLQELDDGFFDRARNYLEMKRDPESHLENREYRNARNILEDILDMRQKKIVRLAFLAVKSDVQVEHLLEREEALFEAVREDIDDYRSSLHGDLFSVDGEQEGTAAVADGAEDEPAGREQDAEEARAGTEPDATQRSRDSIDADAVSDSDDDDETDPGEDAGAGATQDREQEDDATDETQIFGPDDADDGNPDAQEDAAADMDPEESAEPPQDTGSDTGGGDDMETVIMTQDVSEFMGVDLNAYGPYEEGDEATVPAKNADVLVDQGKAEKE